MADRQGTTAALDTARGVNEADTPTSAQRGRALVAWSERRMPALASVARDVAATRPLEGRTIAGSLHVTPETAAFARCMQRAGARVVLCGSNPLSTRDDIVATLREHDGMTVHARYGEDRETYYANLSATAECAPDIVLDDGADLIAWFVEAGRANGTRSRTSPAAGIEQTTTGVQRLRAMTSSGSLPFPVVALNDAPLKQEFDNLYGTGQNTFDGILRATNVLVAGKTVVVAGYGWAGRGVAERARGMGAIVIVTEVDPVRALHAHYDGFRVLPMDDAARVADLIVTATGCREVVGRRHMRALKDGVILANSGHFDVEVDTAALDDLSTQRIAVRPNLTEHSLANGRTVYLLARGRLVGQSAAEASPADIMDLTFTLMALTVLWVAGGGESLDGIVLPPAELTSRVAATKLAALGVHHDRLTASQRRYVSSWASGT